MFCNVHHRSPSHPWLHLLQGIYIFFAVVNVTDFARVLWLTGNCRKDIDFSVDFSPTTLPNPLVSSSHLLVESFGSPTENHVIYLKSRLGFLLSNLCPFYFFFLPNDSG